MDAHARKAAAEHALSLVFGDAAPSGVALVRSARPAPRRRGSMWFCSMHVHYGSDRPSFHFLFDTEVHRDFQEA